MSSPNKHLPVLSVKDLTKEFAFMPQMPADVKSLLISLTKNPMKSLQSERLRVLENVSFDVHRGEFVAIMGRNGAGKSTLIRLLSGVYEPTSGKIIARGSITPLISLKAGFSPELSGYENIFLNAAILGFGRARTLQSLQSIIDFSELEDKIYMPVRQYSSGMIARLGFSIAVHLDSPILLLDEVLGV
jgi:ABC-type polysaccharide/polyol phosphate transport system ATPase subunit